MSTIRLFTYAVLASIFATASIAQSVPPRTEGPMTVARMTEILTAIDPEAEIGSNGFRLIVKDAKVVVFVSPDANRMRAMVRIGPADAADRDLLFRLMQANFDAVLDARYAVASDQIWAVFIHPLASLQTRDFISGLSQLVNAAQSFGTTFTGGGVQFGGGDSNLLQLELLEQLTERGVPL